MSAVSIVPWLNGIPTFFDLKVVVRSSWVLRLLRDLPKCCN